MSEDIENRALKAIAKGASVVFIGMVISKILTYLFRLFIARYFGPADYGLFSIGLAIISFASVFALLGLSTGVIRYVSHYRAKEKEPETKGVITSSLKIVLPVSILMCIILIAISPYLAFQVFNMPELVDILIILAFTIPFSSLTYIFSSSFIGFQKIKYQVYTESIFCNLVKVVAVVVLGLIGFGVAGIAISWTLAWILTFILSFFYLEKRVLPLLRSKVKSVGLKRELLSYSLPLTMVSFIAIVMGWTDTLMLGLYKTAEIVGVYNAAMPTAQFMLVVSGTITSLFLSVMTALHSKNKLKEMKNVYKLVTKWIFYLTFPLFLILVFFSRQVLNVLFGYDYISGYIALSVLAVGYLVHTLFATSSNVLHVLKKTRYSMMNSIIAACVNVPLNIILIPEYGIFGAALATGISFLILGVLAGVEVAYFTRTIPLSRNLLKAVAAGLISIFIIDYLARSVFASFPFYLLIILFIIFAALYSFLILLFRGFEKGDIEILKAMEDKSGTKIAFLRRFVKRFI